MKELEHIFTLVVKPELKDKIQGWIDEAASFLGVEVPPVNVMIVEFKKPGAMAACLNGPSGPSILVDYRLRPEWALEFVYHELCHAWTGVDDINTCPLMNSNSDNIRTTPLTKEECQSILKKYVDAPEGSYPLIGQGADTTAEYL